MFYFLSLICGALISVMVLANGELTGVTGVYSGSVIVHVTGLLLVIIALIVRREKVRLFPKGIPWYWYLGGVLGVWTTASNNLVFGKISVTAIVGLDLLGETVTSLIIDRFGLFGLPKRPFSLLKILSIAIVGAGIAVMLFPMGSVSLVTVLIGLSAGVTVVLSRSVNGVLSEDVGPMQSTLYNYITGLLGSIVVLLLVGMNEPAIVYGTFPKGVFVYLGGAMGVVTVLVLNIVVQKIPAFYLTLLQFIGMALGSIVIDAVLANGLDMGNLLGGIFCTAGMLVDLMADKALEKKAGKV